MSFSSNEIKIRNLSIGGDSPILIQSMTNTDTADPKATAEQIIQLAEAGSEIVRITVNNEAAAKAVPEIRQVLDNLNAVLEGSGSALQSTVKLTVFVTDLCYISEVNEVFNEYFPEKPPARSAVQVSALPMGARIEIEAIGIVE